MAVSLQQRLSGACNEPGCKCCGSWLSYTVGCLETSIKIMGWLNANMESLRDENQKQRETIRDLVAKQNGIKAVPAKDKPKSKRPPGRSKGCPPNRNTRPKRIDREEVADCKECPECGGALSDVTETRSRVVTNVTITTENVLYHVRRRRCAVCKKQVTAKVPNAEKYARVSTHVHSLCTTLNTLGISHGRVSEVLSSVLGRKISRTAAYRYKKKAAGWLAPEHETIKREILNEPYLGCDEVWWNLGSRGNGKVLMAVGAEFALAEVVESRDIPSLQNFLPGYSGIVGQDSYTGWFHVGTRHQMCLIHQIRQVKKDLEHGNPKGHTKTFLTGLKVLLRTIHRAGRLPVEERVEMADRFEAMLDKWMNYNWPDDEDGTIARYVKRYRRERDSMLTFLRVPGVRGDNNHVERANRPLACIRSDGGGNRSIGGMKDNSILFTIRATDRINGGDFYEHVIRAASGDG